MESRLKFLTICYVRMYGCASVNKYIIKYVCECVCVVVYLFFECVFQVVRISNITGYCNEAKDLSEIIIIYQNSNCVTLS